MSAQAEMWRVTTPEGTFEADLETLKQWIAEGAVIATDKVSKEVSIGLTPAALQCCDPHPCQVRQCASAGHVHSER